MIKKIMLLTLVLAVLATPVFAAAGRYGNQISRPLETTGIFVDVEGNNMDYGTWVYGMKLFADDTGSFVGIYNADTEGECTTTANLKDEIGEATQYDTTERNFAKPLYFSDGVFAVMTTGVAWIEYGAQP